ncbi:MAG: TonB-dependent receptor [Candidatus Solibacter sp.]
MGSVTDASGAAVPEAAVQIVQLGTNTKWSLVANEVGQYYAPNMPPGQYRVTVQKEGFSTATSGSVDIGSQANVRVDIKLQLGAVTQTVEISGQGALLDTSTATTSTSLNTKSMGDLPVISFGEHANVTAFLQYLPGAETTSPAAPVMDGSQASSNEVYIDGAAASPGVFRGSIWENGAAVNHYGEFNVVTNSFSAEYGRTGTFFYSVSIKSGTNSVHGSIYDNFVNTALNARDFFQATRQIYHQNGGGYTLAGPVYIPKVYDGRNKTFFFFGHDLFYSTGAQSGTLQTIPSMAFRQGDFGSYTNGGVQIPIFDPISTNAAGVRTQFPNNAIPDNRISKVSKNIMAMMPQPDLPGNLLNWHNRTGANPEFNNFTITFRVDHSLSDKEKVSLSFTDEDRPRLIAGIGWGASSPLEGLQTQPLNAKTARLSLDSTIRPSIINHVTLGYDRYLNPAITNTYGQGWNTKLGIQGVAFDTGTFPAVSFPGGTNPPISLSGGQYALLGTVRWALNDAITVIKGHHFVKMGFNYSYEVFNNNVKAGGNGSWQFANTITSQPLAAQAGNWGSAFASFLLGAPSSATDRGPLSMGSRFPYTALFIQDEWHVTPKLSLSLGLRWETNRPPFDKSDRYSNFSPTTANPDAGNLPGALIFSGTGTGTCNCRTTVQPWNKGFSPRVGYAYQFTPKLVMRSSLGLYYNADGIIQLSMQGIGVSASFPSPDAGFTPSYASWDNPMPNFNTQFVRSPGLLNAQTIGWYRPDYVRASQVLSWTAGFQYELSPSMVLDLTYIGKHGTHLESGGFNGGGLHNPNALDPKYLALGTLLQQRIDSPAAIAAGIKAPWAGFASFALPTVGQALRPYPQYNIVNVIGGKDAIQRYHSLQAKLTRRFSKGLTMMGSFTWSKNLTNVGTAQNPFDWKSDIAATAGTIPADLRVSAAYDLPFGKGKSLMNSSNRVLNGLVGGWQIVLFIQRGSGSPLSIGTSNILATYGYNKRANYVAGAPLTIKTNPRDFDPAIDTYVNAAAFANPATYTLGNTARALDWLRGFSTKSESASINKTFKIRERFATTFGADLTNPMNLVRWTNPVTSLTASNFGKVTGSNPGRRVQLNLEVKF